MTAKEATEYVGISKTNPSSIFKRKCGMSNIDYLSNQHIEKAKELLHTGDMSVPDITGQRVKPLMKRNKTIKEYAA